MSDRSARLAALVLVAVQALLLGRTAWDKADTADEPTYLTAAALLGSHGDYRFNPEALALPKWGFAIGMALFGADVAGVPDNPGAARDHVLWNKTPEQIRTTLFAARTATIVVVLAGGWMLGLAAAMFGPWGRLTAQSLWTFSPTVLANGALATHDAWGAAMLCGLLWAFVRFAQQPGTRRALEVGVALGLALSCKSTALLAAPGAVAAIVVIVRRSRNGTWGRVVALLAGCVAAAAMVVWAVYGFRTSYVPMAPLAQVLPSLPRRVGPVPAGRWIDGLLHQWELGVTEHVAYALGHVFHSGVWWFYVVAAFVKTTIASQVLFVANAAARVRRGGSWLADAALLSFPAILLVVLSLGVMQRGVRYLLPAFPFVILWLARGSANLIAESGSAGRIFVSSCLIAGAMESVAVHPHHLMFFNAWAGGPMNGPRWFVVGDDWGQDQRRLVEWQRTNAAGRIFYTPYSAHPDRWGLDFASPPCVATPGRYALQAVEVHRPRRIDEGCLDWLTVEPPDDRLGYSIYLYTVDEARVARLVSERGRVTPFWRSGPAGDD